jgi:hypothetical protein
LFGTGYSSSGFMEDFTERGTAFLAASALTLRETMAI